MSEDVSTHSDFDLLRSNRIHRQLQIRAVSGLVLLGLILGAVFTVQLYRGEIRQLEAELSSAVELQTAALEAEINRLTNIATQITSRTRIRQELEKYNRRLIGVDALAEFSRPKLADAMRLAPEVTGISRLDASGDVLFEIGEPISPSLWPKNFQADTIQLGVPNAVAGNRRLVISAPISGSRGVKAGIDLVAFDYRQLDEILEEFFQRYRGGGHIRIAAVDVSGSEYLLSATSTEQASSIAPLGPTVNRILAGGGEGLQLITGPDETEWVFVRYPFGESGWYFVYLENRENFFASARESAARAMLFIVMLTVAGSLLTILALRPLSGRISVETGILLGLLQEHRLLLSDVQLSESRLREAQQVAHIGSWEFNLRTGELWWSDEVYRIFGLNPRSDRTSYKTFIDIVHPEDRESVDRAYREPIDNRLPYELVHRLRLGNGDVKYVKERGETIYDEATGKPIRSIGTVQDISEQYRQERDKNRFHAILNAVVEGSSDVIFVKDVESRYLLVNRAITSLTQLSREDIVGKTDFDLFPEHLAEKYRRDDRRVVETQQTETFEDPLIVNDRKLSFLTTKGPLVIDGVTQGVFGIARDISQRIETEQRLRQSEESYRGLFNSVLDGIFILDQDGRVVDVNEAVEQMYGHPRRYFTGKYLTDLADPRKSDLADLEQSWQQVLRGNRRNLTFWGRRINGQAFPKDIMLNRGCFNGREALIAVARDISEQVENQARLARVEWEWNQAMDQFEDAIYLIDMKRQLKRANQAFYRMIGSSPERCIGRPIADLIHPDGNQQDCPVCRAQEAVRDETIVLEPGDRANPCDGPVEVKLKVVRDDSDTACGMLLSVRDLSEIRRTQERLRLAASVFENTGEGVVITDADGNIVEVNRAFSEITGYRRDEVIGRNPRIWQSGRHDKGFFDQMWAVLRTTGEWRGELWNRRKDGTIFPELLTISSVFDDDHKLTHYVGVFTDIGQLKQTEQQLDHLAHHDSLTGLPNRLFLYGRLEQAIRHAERRGTQLAVIFQDLDNFKNINDSFGHPLGDELLTQVAAKLMGTMRREDIVARLGGDEFVTVLEDIGKAENVLVAAEKLMAAFAEPFPLGGLDIRVTTSIGISLYPSDGKDVPTLLRNADAAMYRAKAQGRNTYQFYTQELTRNAFERIVLENDLRRALDEEQLLLVYQPQVELLGGRVVGVEALLRWRHPELGLVPPVKFIPLAEECGLILQLGEYVLNTACRQGKRWLEKGVDFGCIAVNISAIQIQRGGLLDEVKKALALSAMPAARLELEVTEGFIMTQAEFAVGQLSELRQLGVTLSIDDFGTGYSSLNYLKKLPIHKLKIDQSFVRDIPNDANDMAIADAVIALGKSLGLTVIAEGVENAAQRQFLFDAGCQEGQGFLFGEPLSVPEFEQWMAERNEASAGRR